MLQSHRSVGSSGSAGLSQWVWQDCETGCTSQVRCCSSGVSALILWWCGRSLPVPSRGKEKQALDKSSPTKSSEGVEVREFQKRPAVISCRLPGARLGQPSILRQPSTDMTVRRIAHGRIIESNPAVDTNHGCPAYGNLNDFRNHSGPSQHMPTSSPWRSTRQVRC